MRGNKTLKINNGEWTIIWYSTVFACFTVDDMLHFGKIYLFLSIKLNRMVDNISATICVPSLSYFTKFCISRTIASILETTTNTDVS